MDSRPRWNRRDEHLPSVFVFVSPAYGHVNPLLPLIQELVRIGYLVRVYTGGGMRERIEKTGAVCIDYDPWYEMGQSPEGDAYGFLRMLELSGSMDEAVGHDAGRFKPRFAIVDTESIWGRLLAEKHGLPVALSSATQIMNLFTIAEDWLAFFKGLEPYEDRISRMLERLTTKGFPKHTLLSLLIPGEHMNCVAYIPESLQGQLETIDRSRVFFAGFSRDPGRRKDEGRELMGAQALQGSMAAAKKGNRPLLYVTMGTVAGRTPWFFRSCIAALRNMDMDVIMAVWNEIDLDALGPLPDNIRAVREVDQAEVLKRADAALFHAGLNTVVDCLLLGVPMTVYPTLADQFANAKRVEETGTGIRITDHRPDTIRKAVSALLTDVSYRERAVAMGEHMRALGGGKKAAAWVVDRMDRED